MKSWFQSVSELESHGESYVLITVMGARGSTPRDSGTKMVVSAASCYGTIGGGHLEFQAIKAARELLLEQVDTQKIEHFPLGAKLGQCCGGSTTLLFECFMCSMPNIMLFGAGHVGRALVDILSQLPCQLSWVDTRESEFPVAVADNIKVVLSDEPVGEISTMAAGSYYVIMTHNHPLDFALTEAALLRNDARYIGLIGSTTKWQRFKMRFEHR
ncbi:MAG: xanthine dehydrogenase accessory factor, partial [Halieaceae bacterium]